MPPNVQLLRVADFTSGLNLADDPFKLGKGESPDLLNVDLDERGGFHLRRGTTALPSVLTADPWFIDEHVATDGTKRLIFGYGQSIYSVMTPFWATTLVPWFLAGSWASGAPVTYAGPFRVQPFEALGVRRIYVQRNAENVPLYLASVTNASSIDAVGLSASSPTWQESYAVTNSASMPKAKCICSHTGYMWVANTVEGSTKYPNRVRFSHPNVPTAWRLNDYIDVSGLDGDVITAIVSNGDHLLVFQNNATHAIYGYSPETFQFITISSTVGAVSQEAVISTPNGVYAFDAERGVYLHQGKREPVWQFERIFPALRDHRIPQANLIAYIRLAWVLGRLWVTVPWKQSTDDPLIGTTFVLDPVLSKDGSWTRFTLVPAATFADLDGNAFSSMKGSLALQVLEQDIETDSGVGYASYYRTAWYDLGQPAVRKRWKRFETVVKGGIEQQIQVSVYRDYDNSAADRIVELNVAARATDLVWDDAVIPLTAWDEASWRRIGSYDVIVKGGALGPARAVQLRFNGPNSHWALDAFTLKYITKRIR